MDWFVNLIRKRATDWYFAPLEEKDEIPPDEVYISVFLRSMREGDRPGRSGASLRSRTPQSPPA